MSRQPTLFDMAMHAKRESTTRTCHGLWRDLEAAQQRIHALEQRLRERYEETQRHRQRIHALKTEASLHRWDILLARCQAPGAYAADAVRTALVTALTHLALRCTRTTGRAALWQQR